MDAAEQEPGNHEPTSVHHGCEEDSASEQAGGRTTCAYCYDSAPWFRLAGLTSRATPVLLAARAIILSMPRPTNERQALERELREALPARLAAYQQELAAASADKVRREQIEWQIRRVEARMATVRAWLAENVPADDC